MKFVSTGFVNNCNKFKDGNMKEILDKEQQIRSVIFKAKNAIKYMGIPYGIILTMARRQIDQLPHILIGSRPIFRKEVLNKWKI